MNSVDIVVTVVIAVAVVGVIGWLVYRKVKHRGGCCDCNGCTACDKYKKEDN